MGVPVVTMAGDRHAARVSASLLHAAGLQAWVADSPEAFTRTAVALASDRPALARWRVELRERLRASPLLDAAAYGRRLHAALADLYSSPR
jgi:predicted O-linked N-acetylglucosamine transferase (SPINDLY family)